MDHRHGCLESVRPLPRGWGGASDPPRHLRTDVVQGVPRMPPLAIHRCVSVQDEDLEALYGITMGELVDVARLNDRPRAHPGMTADALRRLILSPQDNSPGRATGPYDGKRREVMNFLSDNAGRVQVLCHQDCFQHGDARVAQCWLRIQRKVK